jgi:nitrogen fixation protein NifX
MRVAFATMSQDKIDAHFGLATTFSVYDITPEHVVFICSIHLPEQFDENDKVENRVEILKECAVIYCTQIGGPAAARLVQQNIQPLKASEGTLIQDELERFQAMLKGNPPPWLRKRLIEEMKSEGEISECQSTKD